MTEERWQKDQKAKFVKLVSTVIASHPDWVASVNAAIQQGMMLHFEREINAREQNLLKKLLTVDNVVEERVKNCNLIEQKFIKFRAKMQKLEREEHAQS